MLYNWHICRMLSLTVCLDLGREKWQLMTYELFLIDGAHLLAGRPCAEGRSVFSAIIRGEQLETREDNTVSNTS